MFPILEKAFNERTELPILQTCNVEYWGCFAHNSGELASVRSRVRSSSSSPKFVRKPMKTNCFRGLSAVFRTTIRDFKEIHRVSSAYSLNQLLCPYQIDRSSQIVRKETKPQLGCGFRFLFAEQAMRPVVPFHRAKGVYRQAHPLSELQSQYLHSRSAAHRRRCMFGYTRTRFSSLINSDSICLTDPRKSYFSDN